MESGMLIQVTIGLQIYALMENSFTIQRGVRRGWNEGPILCAIIFQLTLKETSSSLEEFAVPVIRNAVKSWELTI